MNKLNLTTSQQIHLTSPSSNPTFSTSHSLSLINMCFCDYRLQLCAVELLHQSDSEVLLRIAATMFCRSCLLCPMEWLHHRTCWWLVKGKVDCARPMGILVRSRNARTQWTRGIKSRRLLPVWYSPSIALCSSSKLGRIGTAAAKLCVLVLAAYRNSVQCNGTIEMILRYLCACCDALRPRSAIRMWSGCVKIQMISCIKATLDVRLSIQWLLCAD